MRKLLFPDDELDVDELDEPKKLLLLMMSLTNTLC